MINHCPICDTKCNKRMSTIDYVTGMVFCDNHLAKCESIYRYKVFGNSNALSTWLRVIADIRDTYQASQGLVTMLNLFDMVMSLSLCDK